MSKDILTGWLENSNGGYFTPKTFDTLVFMKAASDAQGKLVDLPTYFQEAIFDREIKIDLSHNNTCAFGSMEDGSWPGVTGILGTANGGTGNADGYIRTGAYPGSFIGQYATAEGENTFAWGRGSHIEGGPGKNTGLPDGISSTSTKEEIYSSWQKSAQNLSLLSGFSMAFGDYSHVEGTGNLALGLASHAQGYSAVALGDYSFASGIMVAARNIGAIATGNINIADGEYSSTFGGGNCAYGDYSCIFGENNKAYGDHSFIIGKFANTFENDNLAFVVGNGTGPSDRSNAFAIDWDGNAFVKTRLTAADATITNGLSVTDIEVGNNLTIGNDLATGGKATIAKQLTVSSEGANITGPTSIVGALGVSDGAFTTTSDATIGGNLSVAGTSSFTGLLTAANGINAQAASTFDDTVTIGKDLTVSTSASIGQGLAVNGDVTISGYIANATWTGQIIATTYGGTGVDGITSNALVCGGGPNNPIIEIPAPGALNYFLVSGPTNNPAPSYQRLDFAETHDGEKYNLTLKLGNASTAFDTIVINGANTTSAGLVTTGAQTFAGNKTFANNVSVEGVIEITSVNSDLLPEEGTYMLGSSNCPWQDVFAWNIAADDITSAFGGLRISNGTTQIELVQNNKITLTSSQVDLSCGAITLSNANYGYELPETGIEGQVFFLLLEE